MSYNEWLYVYGNPLNHVDPTGQYAQVEVHRNLTLVQARIWGRTNCRGRACAYVDWIAELIAMGDYAVDAPPLWSAPIVGAPGLHFEDQETARANAQAAVTLGEPYLFGAALHQVQDWYSHWNEGFHSGFPGHALTSRLAGCPIPIVGEGPCRRHPSTVRAFYAAHARPEVEDVLAARYPGVTLAAISDDKLIDLYLQEFTSGAGHLERVQFGYDTDYFFGFTSRDMDMTSETAFWIMRFFETLDPCLAEAIWLRYTPPNASEVLAFLQ